MHILFIGFVWPEPLSSAASQNILSYVTTCIKSGWRVSFCSAADETPQSFDFSSINVNTFKAKLNSNCFNSEIENIAPDIVIFDRFLSFEQFAWRIRETLPETLLILDAEDLHFLREARRLLFSQQQNSTCFQTQNEILEANNQSLLYNPICLREMACIYQADLTLVLSAAECLVLKQHFNVPTNQVLHLPFILPKVSQSVLEFEQKKDFVFIGNFRHLPNYQAAKTLAQNCWPQIFKTLKKRGIIANCHVYGAYLSPKAKQLENKAINFFVHGFAEDQFTVISQARLMLAPIEYGAGVKGKLLDSMLCSTPSVTTAIGAEGISHQQWGGKVAPTMADFIDSAVELYSDKTSWQKARDIGYQILHKNFDPSANQLSFIQGLQQAFEHKNEYRQQRFMQQLLNQQQFRATKYMSQWIEAKNKNLSRANAIE